MPPSRSQWKSEKYMSGVGQTPRSSTLTPADTMPAATAADGHHAPARLGGEGAEGLAQAAREVGVEVLLGDAADVVLAEDGGIQSRTSTWWRSRRSCESQFWKRSSSA